MTEGLEQQKRGGSGRPLRTVLLAVIAVGLLVIGGGLAVAFDLGRPGQPSAESVDAGFSWDMSVHHLQAVQMANLVPERSTDLEVRQLAFDISSLQNNQVGRMHGWLSLWGLPPRNPSPTMAWMEHDGHHGHHMSGGLMPGMATEEELANLRGLSGTEFDVEFLRLMIHHHQGGFEMAEYAAEHSELQPVRTLARAMADTQVVETETMIDMLTARGGTPLPPP